MEDIKLKVLKTSIDRLTAIGAQFHVVFDGKEYGNAIGKKKRRPRNISGPRNAKYIENRIAEMKAGETKQLEMQQGDTISRFQSNVCAIAAKLFGSGNYVSARKGGQAVELLRVL